MKERETDISFLSELWEDEDSEEYQQRLEEMFSLTEKVWNAQGGHMSGFLCKSSTENIFGN